MSAKPKSVVSGSTALLGGATLPLVVAMVVAWVASASLLGDMASPETLKLGEQVRSLFLWCFLGGGAAAIGLLAYRLRTFGIRSDEVEGVLERLTVGDATAAAGVAREHEMLTDKMQDAFVRIGQRDERVRATVTKLGTAVEAFGSNLTTLLEAVVQQTEVLQAVSGTVDSMKSFLEQIGTNVNGLSHSAQETSSSVLQMVTINNQVSENLHNLASSVEETTTAIEEMTFSVKEVANNIDDLSTAAEETAASMNEMDVSISQVETNANETSRLSETVTGDAEIGVAAIKRTIQGIDRIKDSSRVAAEVITSLGQKISEIGNILTVIDDVAEQTNLLALNAAIIAAQAGEHGRGFAVVADEIKALAERTGASTKEIADLIKGVQAESSNAITVMSAGVEAVEEGVRLGHNAEEALIKIVDSAKRSTLMIKAIAQATVEQAKGSKQVTNSISRIAETVQQIALATSEQAKGSEQVMKSAERMRTITQQVERSSEEQNRGGRQVTEAIENIRETVEQVNRAHDQQIRATQKLSDMTTSAVDTSKRARTVAGDVQRLLSTLGSLVDHLSAYPK